MPNHARVRRERQRKNVAPVEQVQMEPITNIGKIPLENFQMFPTYQAQDTPYGPCEPVEAGGQVESTGIPVPVDRAITRQESVVPGPTSTNVAHRGDTPPGFMRVRITQKVFILVVLKSYNHSSIPSLNFVLIILTTRTVLTYCINRETGSDKPYQIRCQ